MADVFDAVKRSDVMAKIRGKGNRSTELVLVSAFRSAHLTGWRRHVAIGLRTHASSANSVIEPEVVKVRPDFIFRAARLAIFVDGCFWHCCPLHSKVPENNRSFWEAKLSANVSRDRRTERLLRRNGWSVLRVWEHDLRDPAPFVKSVARRLARRFTP